MSGIPGNLDGRVDALGHRQDRVEELAGEMEAHSDGGSCGMDCNVHLDFNENAKISKKQIPRNRNIAPSKSATFQYRFLVLLSICQGVSKLQNQLRGVLRCIQVDIFILSCFFFF